MAKTAENFRYKVQLEHGINHCEKAEKNGFVQSRLSSSWVATMTGVGQQAQASLCQFCQFLQAFDSDSFGCDVPLPSDATDTAYSPVLTFFE